MERYIDILLERAEILKNWREYAVKICSAAKSILPDARVYVFGSVVKGKAVGGSDVDILIVSGEMPKSNLERAKIKIRIEELADLPPHHPFELHLADVEEGKWYEKMRLEEIE